MNKKQKQSLLAFSTVILFSAATNANTTYYDNEINFLNTTSGLAVESFETLPAATTQNSNPIITNQLVVSPGANTILGVWDDPIDGPHATAGSNYIRMNTLAGPGSTALTFTFNNPISAFGLYITDFGDYNGGLSLLFSNDVGDSQTVASGERTDGNELFFGLRNSLNYFQSVTFFNQNGIDGTGYDQIYFKSILAPVPAAILLFISGLSGLLVTSHYLPAAYNSIA